MPYPELAGPAEVCSINLTSGIIGLNFLPDASFDGVQDSRLFGSPEFTAQFPDSSGRLAVAQELVRQERRLLKPGGV